MRQWHLPNINLDDRFILSSQAWIYIKIMYWFQLIMVQPWVGDTKSKITIGENNHEGCPYKKSYGSDKYIQISLVVTHLHIWHTFKVLNAFLQGTMHNIKKLYQHYVQLFNLILSNIDRNLGEFAEIITCLIKHHPHSFILKLFGYLRSFGIPGLLELFLLFLCKTPLEL